jgi:tetratricopeptide (TPR) repeat protein
MKMRSRGLALSALLAVALGGGACTQVQAKAAFKDGNKQYKDENYKKAIEHYERAVSLEPQMAEAWFYLGSSHQALYRPGKDTPENRAQLDQAIEAYNKALETNHKGSENAKKVWINTLGALTGIYSEEPFKNYEKALSYAQQLVEDNPNDPKNLYALANLFEKFEQVDRAEETYRKVYDANTNDTKACGALAAFYNKPLWDENGQPWAEGKARRSKFDQAIEILTRCANLDPNDAAGWQKVATFYWDKAYRDPSLTDEQKDAYADKGLEAVDKALGIKPDYFEAVIFKGLLNRVKATVARDPRLKAEFLERAAALQKQGLEIKKQQAEAAAASAAAATPPPGS